MKGAMIGVEKFLGDANFERIRIVKIEFDSHKVVIPDPSGQQEETKEKIRKKELNVSIGMLGGGNILALNALGILFEHRFEFGSELKRVENGASSGQGTSDENGSFEVGVDWSEKLMVHLCISEREMGN